MRITLGITLLILGLVGSFLGVLGVFNPNQLSVPAWVLLAQGLAFFLIGVLVLRSRRHRKKPQPQESADQ